MGKQFGRRDILKMGVAVAATSAAAALAGPVVARAASAETIMRAGIITDMHKTPKADTETRKYSGSMAKMGAFMKAMETEKPNFIVELGDYVDMLTPETDPLKNLKEIDALFTSFNGPAFHVLGNHDFDNIKRDVFLQNVVNTGIPQGQTWYSWDAGGVHCIVLDADYTPDKFRPYDMNTPEDTFWTWKDTSIPPQEMEWLKNDLQKTSLPTILFSHQTLDRTDDNDHNIKNASQVRALLEASGKVLAVISGHDHQGGYSNIKGIHYIVMNGNVGVHDYRSWDATSAEKGLGIKDDNQYAVLEIARKAPDTYTLNFGGRGRQPSYVLERTL